MVDALKEVSASAETYGQLARPLRVPKMAEVVAEYIRRDIVTGVLKQGDSLPPSAVLIERLGVSKPTIREALRILESETLIEVRRGTGGARVQLPNVAAAGRAVGILLQLDQTTLEDVSHARMMFEPPAAGLFARTWDGDDMAKLQEGLEKSRQLLSEPIAFAESQADFHQLVMTLAGNRTLALMARLLDEVVRRHEAAVNKDREHDYLRSAALKEHEDFVKLLAERRDADAESFWRAHLQTNSDNLLGPSGPHTVLDLYSNAQAGPDLRFRF